MILDLNDQADIPPIKSRVCVIGGGAAGITLTRELIKAGFDVALLESGGLDQNDQVDRLMEGELRGFPYYPLAESRLRFFGGTTSIWGGRCAQMDEIDFAKRDWVPYSGWPIEKRDLTTQYKDAQSILDLEPIPGGDSLWEQHELNRPDFDPEVLATRFWQFDTKADRFAAFRHADLFESPQVQVVLNANVTSIRTNEAGNAVESVEFANLQGRTGTAQADVVVLAAGGIENPRLLLASNQVQKSGLGNQNDLVGRFFMEHPHARGARIDSDQALNTLRLLPRSYIRAGMRYAAVGRPADALQESQRLLNTSFTISARQHPNAEMAFGKKVFMQLKHDLRPSRSKRALWHVVRKGILRARQNLGPIAGAVQVKRGKLGLYTVIRAEQSPNPDSRITLSSDRDAVGVPKPILNWQFKDIDKRSVAVTMKALGSQLQRIGLGSVELEPWLNDPELVWKTDTLISSHPMGGYHHMGATRMASSATEGVVDADARVFGVDNLYVAGSSIFATSGWANPTLTILALTFRLAEHLTVRLQRSESD